MELHIGGFADAYTPYGIVYRRQPNGTRHAFVKSSPAYSELGNVGIGHHTLHRYMNLGDPDVAPQVANTNARGQDISTLAIL